MRSSVSKRQLNITLVITMSDFILVFIHTFQLNIKYFCVCKFVDQDILLLFQGGDKHIFLN